MVEKQGRATSRAQERKVEQFEEKYNEDHVSFLPFELRASGDLDFLAKKCNKELPIRHVDSNFKDWTRSLQEITQSTSGNGATPK